MVGSYTAISGESNTVGDEVEVPWLHVLEPHRLLEVSWLPRLCRLRSRWHRTLRSPCWWWKQEFCKYVLEICMRKNEMPRTQAKNFGNIWLGWRGRRQWGRKKGHSGLFANWVLGFLKDNRRNSHIVANSVYFHELGSISSKAIFVVAIYEVTMFRVVNNCFSHYWFGCSFDFALVCQ